MTLALSPVAASALPSWAADTTAPVRITRDAPDRKDKMMTDYEYDPNLPYVVAYPDGTVACRTDTLVHAEVFRDRIAARHIIDTTPKPRVPDDAKFVTWPALGTVFTARQTEIGDWDMNGSQYSSLEDLPGVTPDTVFTVLDERKS